MTHLRFLRAELRKLTTTTLLVGFLAASVVLGLIVFAAVLVGTEAEGVEGFVDTAENQRSLLSFGANALILGGLFGAVAASREYGHGTAVPTYLFAPRRHQAVVAKVAAVFLTGGLIGLVGGALTIVAGSVALPMVDASMVLSGGAIAQLIAGAALAGAVGGVLGVGIGDVLRNTGGAVTVTIVVLMIAPQIIAQLVADAAQWMPGQVIGVISGLGEEPTLWIAVLVLLAWGAVPALLGLAAVQRRDVI